nr:zinc finger, RING/FYVE/PHD-type [Tanacetum cinerariifolium]
RRPRSTKMAVKPKILWKNLHGEAAKAFRAKVTEGVTPEVEGRTVTDAEQMWNKLANTIRGSGQGNHRSGCREFENSYWSEGVIVAY